MMDPTQFQAELRSFRRRRLDYVRDFDRFWRWKTEIEHGGRHVLSDDYRDETCDRLRAVLRRWQHARGSGNADHWLTLKESLGRISAAYDQIRAYSLVQLDRIPRQPLSHIWHELGRVKEPHGDTNPSGRYLVISICKPLMLLWGQTMAFDSNIRGALPTRYGVTVTDRRWPFGTWMRVMEGLRLELEENPELSDLIRTMSCDKYRTASAVPYGRFFDMCYWSIGSPS